MTAGVTMNWQFYLYLFATMQLLAGVLYVLGTISHFGSAAVSGLLLFVFFAIAVAVRNCVLRRL
jgi:ABC-type proline/glycine betaine transport system permease subunit